MIETSFLGAEKKSSGLNFVLRDRERLGKCKNLQERPRMSEEKQILECVELKVKERFDHFSSHLVQCCFLQFFFGHSQLVLQVHELLTLHRRPTVLVVFIKKKQKKTWL